MAIDIVVSTALRELDAQEYRAFARRCQAPLFYDWRFLEAAEQSPLIRTNCVRYVQVLEDGRLLAFIPLYLYTLSDLDPLGVLAKTCNLQGTANEPVLASHIMHCYDSRLLVEEGASVRLEAVFDRIESVARQLGARYFVLLNVADRNLLEAAGRKNLNVRYMVDRYCLDLGGYGDLDSLVESLDYKGRNEVRRQLRKFANEQATIHMLAPPFDERLEQLAELCHTTTADKGTPQFFPATALARFVRLCGGLARILVVERQGQLISGFICFEQHDTLCLWSAGLQYDKTVFSPYTLLFVAAYRYALSNGLRHIEGGRLNARVKQRLGLQPVAMHTIFSQDLHGDQPRLSKAEQVRLQESERYDAWARAAVWNQRDMHRRPHSVIAASTQAEVVAAVLHARKEGLQIAVKTGGHSYSGSFLREGSLLLDLSGLKGLAIDGARARVQAGVTSEQLSQALLARGLAFPVGHARDVAMAGFLLGGGLGINCSQWGGMSAFNIEALDIVTAAGECLRVDEHHHPELFWAARGGGPMLFFIVICFHLKCHRYPQFMRRSTYQVPLARIGQTLDDIRQFRPADNLQVMLALVDGKHGDYQALLSVIAFADREEQACRQLNALIDALANPPLELERCAPIDFESIYEQSDAMLRSSHYQADNVLTCQPRLAAQILERHYAKVHSRATTTLVVWRGRRHYPEAAFSAQGDFFISTYAQWNGDQHNEREHEWLVALYDDLAQIASGAYINEYDLEARPVEHCFGSGAWRKLQCLKQQHDPDEVFAALEALNASNRVMK
jgi:FAD/FMN-containing dehydrogenase